MSWSVQYSVGILSNNVASAVKLYLEKHWYNQVSVEIDVQKLHKKLDFYERNKVVKDLLKSKYGTEAASTVKSKTRTLYIIV